MIKLFVIVLILNFCFALERNENYNTNENETIVDTFLRTMRISDYKVPDVDNLGD